MTDEHKQLPLNRSTRLKICNSDDGENIDRLQRLFTDFKQKADQETLALALEPGLDTIHAEDYENKMIWVLISSGISCGSNKFQLSQEDGVTLSPWLETYGQAQMAVEYVRRLKCNFLTEDWVSLALNDRIIQCEDTNCESVTSDKHRKIKRFLGNALGEPIQINDDFEIARSPFETKLVSEIGVASSLPWKNQVKVPRPDYQKCFKTGLSPPNDEVCMRHRVFSQENPAHLSQEAVRRLWWLKKAGQSAGISIDYDFLITREHYGSVEGNVLTLEKGQKINGSRETRLRFEIDCNTSDGKGRIDKILPNE